jgi:hypothetical protein
VPVERPRLLLVERAEDIGAEQLAVMLPRTLAATSCNLTGLLVAYTSRKAFRA